MGGNGHPRARWGAVVQAPGTSPVRLGVGAVPAILGEQDATRSWMPIELLVDDLPEGERPVPDPDPTNPPLEGAVVGVVVPCLEVRRRITRQRAAAIGRRAVRAFR